MVVSSIIQDRFYAPKASKMPFREKLKRAFTKRDDSTEATAGRKQSNYTVYKPGEVMPRPKYRRPVDPDHKATLDSYSFGTILRKRPSMRSLASMYSPMGSRLASRNASRAGSRAPSRAPSRGPSRGPSRNSSFSGTTPTRPQFGGGKSHITQVVENADEAEDFANVGGPSRFATRPPTPTRSGGRSGDRSGDMSGPMSPDRSGHLSPKPYSARDSGQTEGHISIGRRKRETAHDHVPFSAEEIHTALLRKTTTSRAGIDHTPPIEDSPA